MSPALGVSTRGLTLLRNVPPSNKGQQRVPYRTPVFLVFIVSLFTWGVIYADESGLDLFVKACQYQGHNPAMIFSGYAEILITSRVGVENIPDQMKEVLIANAKERIKDKDELKKVLDDIEKQIGSHNKGDVTFHRKKVLFLGNESENGWRRFESFSKRGDDGAWMPSITGFRYGNSKTKEKNAIAVSRNPSARNTTLGKDFEYVDEFRKFGRLQGLSSMMATLMMLDGTPPEKFRFPPSGIEKFKNTMREISKNDGSFQFFCVKDEVQYDSNRSTATVLESTYKGKVTQRYWIDASRGYVCPKIQFYDLSTGELLEEYTSSDYFLHEWSGLWFPQRYAELRKDATTKKLLEDCDYVIDPKTFSLNQKVALNEFAIDIPENEFIIDTRSNVAYRTVSAGELSINDVDKLDELAWLENVGRGNYEIPTSGHTNRFHIVRIISMSLGIALIVVWLFLKIRKYVP